MEMLMCKKSITLFGFSIVEGKMYFYWENFKGLNHFISDAGYQKYNKDATDVVSFCGDKSKDNDKRPYLYDYFWTKEEMRDIKINKIIER